MVGSIIPLSDYESSSGGGGTGTTVIPNPAGEATADLVKVQIGDVVYGIDSGSLKNQLVASVAVGGISPGSTYAAGTSIETILTDLVNPILYPEFTAPSVTLAGTGSTLLETGDTKEVTLTATFDRGSIEPAYGTSGYRSGQVQTYQLNSGTAQASNTWTETVSGSNSSFAVTANYAAGEQPKDSKGNDYDSPLSAGSVTSSEVTYSFVDPIWANTANISTVAKLTLVARSEGQRDFSFPAQTVANPEVFDIPASWTVTGVLVKDDLSGNYENAASQFTVTDVTHQDLSGSDVSYKRYTFNLGYDTGAREVRVTWS